MTKAKNQQPTGGQKALDCAVIFLVCLIPRLYQTLQGYPFGFVSDETSALSIAALTAGYDWRDVVSQAGYYGIGFLWIFAPLFKMGLSSVVIYRIIASVLAGVNALTGPLFYGIMNRFFHVKNRGKKIVVSGICGNLILFYVAVLATRNEEILALLVCIVTYLLCRIVESHSFRDEILLSLVLLYSLTCHTRAIAIVLAVMAVSLFYAVFYRKKLLHIKTYLINLAGYILIHGLLNLYQAEIWGGSAVRNSSVSSSVGNALTDIFAAGSLSQVLRSWARIVLGQVTVASMLTGGLFLIATIACLIYLLRSLRKREEAPSEMLFVLSVLSLILVYGTIFTQGITWLPGVYEGIYVEGGYGYVYSYKAFSYMRYFGPFVPMMIMTAFCCWEKDTALSGRHTLLQFSTEIAVPCCIGCLGLWSSFILPYISTEKPEYLYFLAGFQHSVSPQQSNWVRILLITEAMLAVYLIVVLLDRVEIALTLSLVLLVCEQVYTYRNLTVFKETSRYKYADAGYELIQNSTDVFGEDIYVYDTTDATDDQLWYLYQFLNYTCHIIPELPEDTEDDFILFANGEISLTGENIYAYQLDDNEYVYTNVPEYMDKIREFSG